MPKNGKKGKKAASLGISSSAAVRLAHKEKNAGVAPFHYATLVYPIMFASSSVTAGVWYWQFRMNSLYDPDFTGGGVQPTTFDQWMTLYTRYRVVACDVDVKLMEASAPPATFGGVMAPSADAVPTLTYAGVGGMRGAVVGTQLTNSLAHFHKTYLMKDVFGVDEEAMFSELNYSGTSGTSAPSVAYLTFATQQSTSGGVMLMHGFLRFAVRFEVPVANSVSFDKILPVVPPTACTVTSVPVFPVPRPVCTLTVEEARLLEAYRAAPPRQ
jgi:hypothetical protein